MCTPAPSRWRRWPRPSPGWRSTSDGGDDLRTVLWQRTRALLEHLDKLGIATTNTSGLPVVELPLADPSQLHAAGHHLFDRGIYVAFAPYPVVPRHEAGFRIQLTAAHTAKQVDHLLEVLQEVD